MDVRTESLRRASERLAEVMAADFDEPFVLDAAVQRFEFTYELAWKTLRRRLLERLPEQSIEGKSRLDLFRIAQHEGLLREVEPWVTFHEARNLTSHTYREETARTVAALGRSLLPEVRYLLERIEAST